MKRKLIFVSMHGIQIVNRQLVDYILINRPSETEVRISDTLPIEKQLRIASIATAKVLRSDTSPADEDFARMRTGR